MQHFFADRSAIQGNKICLEGPDLNHMKNVLRMKPGEDVQISDGDGTSYLCCIDGYEENRAALDILKISGGAWGIRRCSICGKAFCRKAG